MALRLFEDRSGSVWVATSGGVDRFRAGPFAAPTGALRAAFAAVADATGGGLLVASYSTSAQHVATDGTPRDLALKFVSCVFRDPEGPGGFGAGKGVPRIAELWKYRDGRPEGLDLPS